MRWTFSSTYAGGAMEAVRHELLLLCVGMLVVVRE
jgi:hypothetical protein